ncbi:MAG: hypothetical protein IJ479_03475 [Alphaproteobacteria bacterium]|nr:hypothetical protein [Alphaproteobacteria bacterium]
MEAIKLDRLTENKTFTVKNSGHYMMPSLNRMTINAKKILIAVWRINNVEVLRIESTVPGSWRILRDGRKAHRFIPDEPSPFVWEVVYE